MGLDITVYTRVEKAHPTFQKTIADSEDPREEAYEMGFEIPYVEEGREKRAAGLELGVAYKADDRWGFRAGSYSGYNQWREQLAQLAGVDDINKFWNQMGEAEEAGGRLDVPFAELIAFSDCEGTLGPEVCARLAKDFAKFDERASQGDEYFYDKYQEWRRAVEDAAQNGFISFH
jgi:hypothetical protein